MKRMIAIGALGGLLWAAAFSIFINWPLVRWFTGLAGLVLLLSLWTGERASQNPRAVAVGSFAFGLSAFSIACHWIYYSVRIVNGGPVALAIVLVILLAALMGCWYALGGYWAARMQPKSSWLGLIVILPSVLVLTELLRGWAFTGFPWLSAGYLTGPVFAGNSPTVLASLGGVYLIGWLTAALAGACLLLLRWPAGAGRRAIGLLLLLGGFAGLGQVPLPDQEFKSNGELHARLVQGGIPQERKWLEEQFWPTLLTYETMSFGRPQSGASTLMPQLIVWPEVAIPATQDAVRDYLDEMDRLLLDRNMTLALGILTDTDEGRLNSLIALGEGDGEYHKRHLVPFGEFFPLPDPMKDWLLSMELPASDLASGPVEQKPIRVGQTLCGASICYEAAFGAEQRKWAPEVEVLINVSNDGWFGNTVALEQHLDMARMRAMETRRYLLRATGTGITAAVDPSGRILARLPKYEAGFLDVSVPRLTGSTPYVRYGDWPIVVLCLLLGVALPVAVRIRNGNFHHRRSTPPGEQE